MNSSKIMATMLTTTMVASSIGFIGASKVNAAGISIDATNFPDEVFREYLKEEHDDDGDGFISEDEMPKGFIQEFIMKMLLP